MSGFYQNHLVGSSPITSPKRQWKPELTKVAEFNRKVMPAGELEEKDTNSTQRQGDFRDLFSSKEMTKRTLISGFAW